MAVVTLSVAQLAAALRLGDSTEETAEATRLLAFATEAVTRHAPDAPDTISNEAAIRIAGYALDAPNAGRGAGWADIGRNSGAWALLLPYRVHRAGSTAAAVAMADEAVGSPGNPVTNISVTGSTLTITFADGTNRTDALPAGSGGSSYLGAWSALSAAERAAIAIGDRVLHQARFWTAHILSEARVREPGSTGTNQSDGWHPARPTYRGAAAAGAARHYDVLDVAFVTPTFFVCLTEGDYNSTEIHGPSNWAALVALSTVETLINLERSSINQEIAGFGYQTQAQVDARVAVWALVGATSHIPSLNLPASEQAQRGAVAAGIADDVDESPGARQATALAWTATLLRRVVTRIVPAWARAGDTTQIPLNKLSLAPGAGGGLNQGQVDARVSALVSDWAEASNTDTVIPAGRHRAITVATSLPAPNVAIGSQFYGTGGSHADRVYWPKRIADQKTIRVVPVHLTEARGDAAIVGWQASPALGLATPPWGVNLGVTRLAIEPSGAGWRISMSGGSGLAHPTGIIVSGISTQTLTLFRRAGTGNSAPIYDSVVNTATRQFVAGASYDIQIRYSGGQNFFNVHDADYLEGIASIEDTHGLQVEIDRLGSSVASLAAAPAGGATVNRYNLALPATSYEFRTSGAQYFPGGESILTAPYPAGTTLASMVVAFKTAVLQADFQHADVADVGVAANESSPAELWGTHTMAGGTGFRIIFAAGGITLALPSAATLPANERDGWRLRLSVVT